MRGDRTSRNRRRSPLTGLHDVGSGDQGLRSPSASLHPWLPSAAAPRLQNPGCGSSPLHHGLAGSKSLAELLTKHGINNEMHVSGGGHTWINWRHYLNDFAPLLFREAK